MADGSLRFDTKINTDGFEEGVSTISRAVKACAKSAEKAGLRVNEAFNKSTQISSLENQITQTEQKIQELSAFLEGMGSAGVPTEEYSELSSLVEKTQLKLDGLLDRQQKLEDQGVSKNSSRWKSLQYDIEETAHKLEIYKAELQDTLDRDRAFTAGQDSAGYAKKAEALENLNNKLYVQRQRLAELVGKESEAAQEAARLREIADNAEVSNQKIVDLNNHLQELKARQKELQAAGVDLGHAEYDQNTAAIKELTEELKEYRKSLEGAGEETEEEAYRFGDCFRAMAETGNIGLMVLGAFADMAVVAKTALYKLASAGFELAKIAAKKFFDVVTQITKSALKQFANVAKKAAQGMMGLGKSFLFGNKQVHSLNRGLGSLIKRFVLYRIVRRLVSSIAAGFKEGMQNFAGYSSGFNATMSSFVSSLSQLQNSFASAFSPITSAILPVLDALIQKLIQAIHAIGQFLAALTGKGTFSKAVKVNQDYAKSMGGAGSAAKKAGNDVKKALAPFDDLVQIQEQSADAGGGGGSGTDFGSLFEEIAIDQGISDFAQKLKDAFAAGDWEGIGRILGEKINETVAKITNFISWENCGEQITKFINAFTAMFNSLVATIDWYAVGMMFGAGIDTLAHTLYLLLIGIDWLMLGTALGEGINGLVDRVDWDVFGRMIGAYFAAKINLLLGVVQEVEWGNIGKALSDALTGLVDEVPWENLGLLFATGFNGVFEAIGTFARNYDWIKLGSSLASSLSTFFRTFDWAGAGTAISDIVKGLLDALITFVTETDWYAFGQGVSDAIQAIDWSGIVSRLFEFIGACFGGFAAFIGGLLADGVAAAKEYFNGKIEECGGNVVLGILKGIKDGLIGIAIWIYNNVFKPFMDGFKNAFGIHSPSTKMAEMGKYLWDGFCNGIKEFFSNPGAFIKANITDPFVNGIKSLLGIHSPSTVLEGIGGHTVAGFNQGVTKGQNSTQTVVQSWAAGVAGWFSSKLGISGGDSAEAQKWASSTMSGYNNSVSSNYTKSQGVMEHWADNIRKWFTGSGEGKGVNEASWRKFANQIILAYQTEISSRYTDTQAPMEAWAEDIRKWFLGDSENKGVNEASWIKFADTIIQAFKTKISGSYVETQAGIITWAKDVREWFWGDSAVGGTGGLYAAFYDMAKRINEGFAKGISDFAHLAKAAIRKWAQEVMEEAREEFDINSPSKEFYEIAEFVVKGFNNAIADLMSSSAIAARKWLDGVMDVFAGVEIQVPLKLDFPNAASYLPNIASGTIIPPRTGGASAAGIATGQTMEMARLLANVETLLARQAGNHSDQEVQPIVLKFTGALAPLARALKPELDKESSRKGVRLIIEGGSA